MGTPISLKDMSQTTTRSTMTAVHGRTDTVTRPTRTARLPACAFCAPAVLPGEHIQDCQRDFNGRTPAVPAPYPLRVLLEDLIKRVLRLLLTPISRFTQSFSPGAFTEHELIIVATRRSESGVARYQRAGSARRRPAASRAGHADVPHDVRHAGSGLAR